MSRPFIVIIEDNPAEVDLLRLALNLRHEPYELAVLADGAEALRFVSERHDGSREPEPCVMLLDVHLPKHDGVEVLAAVRREPLLRHVHVVMLASGSVRREVEAKIQSLGAIFRQKPRDFPGVKQLAQDVLELCRKAMSLA